MKKTLKSPTEKTVFLLRALDTSNQVETSFSERRFFHTLSKMFFPAANRKFQLLKTPHFLGVKNSCKVRKEFGQISQIVVTGDREPFSNWLFRGRNDNSSFYA